MSGYNFLVNKQSPHVQRHPAQGVYHVGNMRGLWVPAWFPNPETNRALLLFNAVATECSATGQPDNMRILGVMSQRYLFRRT